MKKKELIIIIISALLIVIVIIIFLIISYNKEYIEFIINNKYIQSFSEINKISEKPCYKTKPILGILGEISHDYENVKVKNCKKIEYRGIVDNKYYTYFIISRPLTKTVKESFSSQEEFFSTADTIVNKLDISNKIKDMYISGIPDYSLKGNEFGETTGNISNITIYVKQNLKNSINQELFNKYMLVNEYVHEEDYVEVHIKYEDGYMIEFNGLWLMLYKNNKLILDNNKNYDIETYDKFIQLLYK